MIYDVIKIGVPIWKHEKWDWIGEDDIWKAGMHQNVEIKAVNANHFEFYN